MNFLQWVLKRRKSYSGKVQSFTIATASLTLNKELNSCLYLGFLRAAGIRRQRQKHGNVPPCSPTTTRDTNPSKLCPGQAGKGGSQHLSWL